MSFTVVGRFAIAASSACCAKDSHVPKQEVYRAYRETARIYCCFTPEICSSQVSQHVSVQFWRSSIPTICDNAYLLKFDAVLLQTRPSPKISVLLAYRVSSYSHFSGPMPKTEHYRRPDVHYHCDVSYDPFLYMQENQKIYGTSLFSECGGRVRMIYFPRVHNYNV